MNKGSWRKTFAMADIRLMARDHRMQMLLKALHVVCQETAGGLPCRSMPGWEGGISALGPEGFDAVSLCCLEA
jgi:hypothetical protein